MIGMEPIALPRIVAQHDRRLQDSRITPSDLAGERARVLEFAVDLAEERRPRRAPPSVARRCSLLVLARGDECGRSAPTSHVPFEPSVQHEVVHDAAGCRPLRQRSPAPELDVVGMGADGQRADRRSMSFDQSRSRPSMSAAAGRVRWLPREHLLDSGVGQLVGRVDVERRAAGRAPPARHAEPMALREVTLERAGAVCRTGTACRPAAR